MLCPVYRRRHSSMRWSPFSKIPKEDCWIADSKMLTHEQRERAYVWITAHCAWGVGVADVDVIETQGILAATQLAMVRALEQLCLSRTPSQLLIDGRDAFRFPISHRSIIRGDGIEPSIAAGSILAKVTRDRMMIGYASSHAEYGFDGHKGYGSAEHIRSIRTHGPCELHRLSFLGNVLDGPVLALCR
jgi:ribonuclease HII